MGAHKQQALKRMCAIYKPDVLLLQEIVCVGSKAAEFLSSFLKEWKNNLVDFEELLGGLVLRWNANLVAMSSNVLNAGIEIEVRSIELGKVYKIINLYNLYYSDKKPF